MLAANDVRITGLRCIEPGTDSTSGVVAAGDSFVVAISVEAGSAIFASGARFHAGVRIDGLEIGRDGRIDGSLGDSDWRTAVADLRLRIPGEATVSLADRLLSVAGFLRINAAPPYLVSVLRGADIFITPGEPRS